jgi:hypothetical protein
MPKTSRPTRISELITASNCWDGQCNPTPEPWRPTGIGDLITSSHHRVGQGVPMPEHETNKDHFAHTRSSKKAFQGPCFNGTRTLNSQQDDAQQGSPRRTIAPRVCEKKRMWIFADPAAGGTRRKIIQLPHTRSSLHWVRWSQECPHSHMALQSNDCACPISHHCYQAEGCTKAHEKLTGPRRSAREIKKGHGSA